MSETLFDLALRVQTEGIEAAKKELAALGKTAADIGTASKEQQKEITRSTSLLAQMAGLVDKQDKAALAGLRDLIAAQKDWARQIGATGEQLLKIEAVEKKLDNVSESAHKGSEGVRKLTRGFESLASEITGVNPVLGRMSASLGELSLGGAVTAGVLAGVAAIGLAFRPAINAWEEATKAGDELISSLANQGKALRENGDAALNNALKFAKANLIRVQSSSGLPDSPIMRAAASLQSPSSFTAFILNGLATNRANELQHALDAVAAAEKNVADQADDLREKGLASDRAMAAFGEGMAEIFKRLAEKEKQAAAEAARALDARIKALSEAIIYDDLRAKATTQLSQIENRLTAMIDHGNLSLERRIELERKRTVVEQALADAARIRRQQEQPTGPTVSITPGDGSNPFHGFESPMKALPDKMIKPLPPLINETGKVAVDAMNKLQSDMASAMAGLAQTLGDGIYEAFAAAFNGEGLGGIFKAFGKTVLAGIGQIFTMMGQAYLEYGIIMSGLVPTLSNPFTAGPTAIAIGALLVALGGALGAISKGAGRGTASAGAFREPQNGTSDIVRLKFVDRPGYNNPLTPQPAMHFTIIGANDPKAQREIGQIVKNNSRRVG